MSANPLFFTSPEEVAIAFYEAISRADADMMMAIWAEDEDVICVHPGALPLVGFGAVRAAWASVFANSPGMRFELQDPIWHVSGTMATQTVVEWIRFAEDTAPRGGVAATNLFIRTLHGWRLLGHHGSPISNPQTSNNGGTLH